ncbi:MAG: thioredoxin domain-containing protein [Pseudomonadota bacterium]
MDRNNLDRESSPYLLQHRDNPVHWQAWGPEALAHAKAENKPVLLSVGYAACHWCHVMAHESFEDPEVAAVMNELFVNIKVDREERPDIDSIYQAALAMLGQQGGWPLTMFLTADGEPFWGGTYFPTPSRYGRPAFTDVLKGVHETYLTARDKVDQNRAALTDALQRMSVKESVGDLSPNLGDVAAKSLIQQVDFRFGGIGQAPKFPHVPDLELLWRAHLRGLDDDCGRAVMISAGAMAQGGIYDHLRGGWARYSVDSYWLVPHFEKMLYDNAQLIDLCTMLWQSSRSDLFRRRIAETVGWVFAEMTTADGAFCSSLDADSDDGSGHAEEGAFYVWTAEEIERLLGDDAAFFKQWYDVTPGGNWEGKTILNRSASGAADDAEEERLAALRQVLLEERAKRPRPGLDDKVLADWNGLMIHALIKSGLAFNEAAWIDAAERAFRWIAETMADGDRLWHSAREGRYVKIAMIDDYAAMARAGLALFEATGDPAYLARARAWVATADKHYWDDEQGGYFFTADDAEALIVRTKTALDNATPSGNAVMVGVLGRLYHLTGEVAYRDRAEAIARTFAGDVTKNPFAHAVLINNLELLHQAHQVVLIGARDDDGIRAMLRTVHESCVPNLLLSVIEPGEDLPKGHPASGKTQVDGKPTAYVCEGPVCSLPMTALGDLSDTLRSSAE